jgi:hypothetical protein
MASISAKKKKSRFQKSKISYMVNKLTFEMLDRFQQQYVVKYKCIRVVNTVNNASYQNARTKWLEKIFKLNKKKIQINTYEHLLLISKQSLWCMCPKVRSLFSMRPSNHLQRPVRQTDSDKVLALLQSCSSMIPDTF